MTQTDDDDDVLGEDLPPTPQTPWLVIVLCVLNIAAGLAFAYLLIMDLDARQTWAAEVFKHDLAMQGIPLKEEESPPSNAALGAQAARRADVLGADPEPVHVRCRGRARRPA